MVKNSKDAAKVSRKGGGGSREYMQDFQAGRKRASCDSCAFEMRRPEDYGTESDGTQVVNLCSTCYADGSYRHTVSNIAEFIDEAVADLAAQRGQSTGKLKLTLKKELKGLPRWK